MTEAVTRHEGRFFNSAITGIHRTFTLNFLGFVSSGYRIRSLFVVLESQTRTPSDEKPRYHFKLDPKGFAQFIIPQNSGRSSLQTNI